MSQNICKHKKKLLSLHKRVLPSPSPSPPSVAHPPLMEGSEWPWLLKAPPPRHLRWLALKPLPRATFGGSPLPLWRGVNGLGY